jgi:hypothetical protein
LAAIWHGEPPPFDKAGYRETENLNKQLTEDLCGGVAIKAGRRLVKIGHWPWIGDPKKRR